MSTLFGRDATRADGKASVCVLCRKVPKQLSLTLETKADYERYHYANDPEYRRRRSHRSSAYRRNVSPLPAEAIDALGEKFGGLCAYCLCLNPESWDHIVPVSKGGKTVPGNIVPACTPCNSRKKDLDVWEFLAKYNIEQSTALESELILGLEWGQL